MREKKFGTLRLVSPTDSAQRNVALMYALAPNSRIDVFILVQFKDVFGRPSRY